MTNDGPPSHRLSVAAVIWAYLAWFVPGLIIAMFASDSPLDPRINYVLVPAYYLAISIFLVRYWYKIMWGELGIPGTDPWRDVGVSILVGGAYVALSLAAAGPSFSEAFANLLGAWRLSKLGFVGRLLFFPIVEELFFRGIAFQVLCRRYNESRATLVTSFLFAAGHMSIAEAPYLFIVGLFLGWCMWSRGSTLFVPMIYHVALSLQYYMAHPS